MVFLYFGFLEEMLLSCCSEFVLMVDLLSVTVAKSVS